VAMGSPLIQGTLISSDSWPSAAADAASIYCAARRIPLVRVSVMRATESLDGGSASRVTRQCSYRAHRVADQKEVRCRTTTCQRWRVDITSKLEGSLGHYHRRRPRSFA
jgi:hypothetical protein